MSSLTYLGELEELILWKVALLEKNAYGVSIKDSLDAEKAISISTVHEVLHRLEKNGFVRSILGEASPNRGGKRKRLFSIALYDQYIPEKSNETGNLIWDRINSILNH